MAIFSGYEKESNINFFRRAQWLRAAVSGANSGLITITSLMIGIGATTDNTTAMILAGVASLIVGACIVAIGEVDSVSTQYDVGTTQIQRLAFELGAGQMENLPNPRQCALASGLGFVVAAVGPLLAVAITRRKHHSIRMIVTVFMGSLALLGIGVARAFLGKTPIIRSCVRVLITGWINMIITVVLTIFLIRLEIQNQ